MPWDSRDEQKKSKRVTASDAILKERHKGFDLAAQDNTMKYERPSFSVGGENTKEAQDLYRANYDKIDWTNTVPGEKPCSEGREK